VLTSSQLQGWNANLTFAAIFTKGTNKPTEMPGHPYTDDLENGAVGLTLNDLNTYSALQI